MNPALSRNCDAGKSRISQIFLELESSWIESQSHRRGISLKHNGLSRMNIRDTLDRRIRMNFFIKVLDDINLNRATPYTAWFMERMMKRYSESQKHYMWDTVWNI